MPNALLRLAAAILAALGAAAAAAQDYPARPIVIVAPFGPGSGSDVHARLVAKYFNEYWGQPVVVENKPGANGAVGARIVAAAKPDGYTLFVGSATTHAVNPALYGDKLGYAVDSFEALGMLGAGPVVLMAGAHLNAPTLAALIAQAKAAPGKLSCGAGNAVMQTACALLGRRAGIEIVTANYKSNAQALGDAAGGHVGIAFADTLSALPFLAGDKAWPLGLSGRARPRQFAAVPLFVESGFPDLDLTAWAALFAPKGVAPGIAAKLNEALRRIYAAPEALALTERAAGFTMPVDLAEARRFVAAEGARWARFIAETGIKPE